MVQIQFFWNKLQWTNMVIVLNVFTNDSASNLEAVRSSERLVTTGKAIGCNNPEHYDRHSTPSETLTSICIRIITDNTVLRLCFLNAA